MEHETRFVASTGFVRSAGFVRSSGFLGSTGFVGSTLFASSVAGAALLAALLALPWLPGQGSLGGQDVPSAVDVTAEQVREFIDALPRDQISDRPIRIVDLGGYRTGVYGVYRPADAIQRAIVHDTNVAEIYYILEGAGVLVTGGELADPSPSSGSSLGTQYGPELVGGFERRVSPGDIIFIPGRTGHWWKSLEEEDITYLIFRPDPDNVQTLR